MDVKIFILAIIACFFGVILADDLDTKVAKTGNIAVEIRKPINSEYNQDELLKGKFLAGSTTITRTAVIFTTSTYYTSCLASFAEAICNRNLRHKKSLRNIKFQELDGSDKSLVEGSLGTFDGEETELDAENKNSAKFIASIEYVSTVTTTVTTYWLNTATTISISVACTVTTARIPGRICK